MHVEASRERDGHASGRDVTVAEDVRSREKVLQNKQSTGQLRAVGRMTVLRP